MVVRPRLRANGRTRLSYGGDTNRAPLREQLPFRCIRAPEWISPFGCLPRTDRQVAEQQNGYSSPGGSLLMMIIFSIQGVSRELSN